MVLTAAPAEAQIVRVGSSADSRQAFGFKLGYFMVKGDDSRVDGDVIFNNHDSLLFDIDEFNSVTFGGGVAVRARPTTSKLGAGRQLLPGHGAEHLPGSVDENGFEIAQELKLRQIPMSGTVRFLPLGREAASSRTSAPASASSTGATPRPVTSSTSNDDVFFDSFEADGTAVGPVILGGVRFPWRRLARRRRVPLAGAEGDTGGIDEGFLGDKIDLGGTTELQLHFRF